MDDCISTAERLGSVTRLTVPLPTMWIVPYGLSWTNIVNSPSVELNSGPLTFIPVGLKSFTLTSLNTGTDFPPFIRA